MHRFGRARDAARRKVRRAVTLLATATLLTGGLVALTALPAAAACGTDGVWIGSWDGHNAAGAQFNGSVEADDLSFSSTALTGHISFVTGTTVVLAGLPVHADVSPSCQLSNGTIGSPTPVVTFGGTTSSGGTEMQGNFDLVGTTTSGSFKTGVVTNGVTNPNTTDLTFPAASSGATPAQPVWVDANSPNSGPMSIGTALVSTSNVAGWAVLGPNGTGIAIRIAAPPASANDPLVLTLELDKSLFPNNTPDPSLVSGFHNGNAIVGCNSPNGPPLADPDPCVAAVQLTASGNLRYTVWSSSASVWMFGRGTKPSAPRSPAAVPGDGRATVSWNPPAVSGGPAITGYTVTPYSGTVALAAHSVKASAKSVVVTGLANGKAYTFKVTAKNKVGTGKAATTGTTTVGAPTAPRSPSATAGKKSATVKWLAPASTNGSSIRGYVVTPFKAGVAQPAVTFKSAATTQVITGLATGKKYTFEVAAKNARGVGPQSIATKAVVPT